MKRKSIQFSLITFIVFIASSNLITAQEESISLHMEDGQIYKEPVKICVANAMITEEMSINLKLSLYQTSQIFPAHVAPKQMWSEVVSDTGDAVQRSGSILYFDLAQFKSVFSMSILHSRKRVFPILSWEDGEEFKTAVSDKSIWLVNKSGAAFLAAIAVGIFLALLIILVKRLDKNLKLIKFLTSKGDTVSMSLFQLATWSVAVGSLVIWHAFIRLDVPDIPETLLVLMGLSAGTGVWGLYQSRQQNNQPNGDTSRIRKSHDNKKKRIKLSSMLFISPYEKTLSIEKAQLLFWTYITIIIFIVKSYEEGQLWDVPYQLVVLMGISQATFLGKKQIALTKRDTTKP